MDSSENGKAAILTTNIKINNIQEFENQITKVKYLLEELTKELKIIRDFKFSIENK